MNVGYTVFTKTEFLERVKLCKAKMQEKGLDVLYVSDPANMHYLTGYDAWSFYVPQCVVISLDENEPYWIGRGIDAPSVPMTTYLKPENVYSYLDTYVHTDDCHPMDFIAQTMDMLGFGNKVIGVEMDSFYFTASCYQLMCRHLPNATIKDAGVLVNWLRAIKSEKEIELMRQAGQIMDIVMGNAIEMIEPGGRQYDIVGKIMHDQIVGTPEFGGDYPAIIPLMPTGKNTSAPHLHWTSEPFKENEVTVMELAACRHRYHCPMARTIFLGDPPNYLDELAKVAEEGIEAALDVVKPGIRSEEIEAAFRQTLAKYGYVKSSRMGYAVGLNYPPDWGEHTISIRPGDRTILQPNMTLHVMPGLWQDSIGVEISQTIRITEDGYEAFGSIPRKLVVKN
jgi:ectoine hydrolase